VGYIDEMFFAAVQAGQGRTRTALGCVNDRQPKRYDLKENVSDTHGNSSGHVWMNRTH
jgi:hypothetical protein